MLLKEKYQLISLKIGQSGTYEGFPKSGENAQLKKCSTNFYFVDRVR